METADYDYRREIATRDYPWMSEDQFECFKMLCDLFYGENHVYGIIRACGSNGIYINTRNKNWCATYDYNGLTRAVVMAHDRCIRFEIDSSGPGMLKLKLHKRRLTEGGSMWERHPALEDHIKSIRDGKKA